MTAAKPIIVINDNYEDDDLPHPYTSQPLSEVQLKSVVGDDYDQGKAWLVLISGFFVMVLIFGIELTFGVYAVAYQEEFTQGESVISWIGSLSYGIMFLIGPLASILISRVGTGIAMGIAGGLTVTGYVTSYFAKDPYHLYISFGLLVGAGLGIAFLCCYAVLPDYFKKYLRVASIIVSIGGGVGIFLFNAIFSHLIDTYGWEGSMLINAGMAMHLFPFALIMKSRRGDVSVRKATISEIMGVHVLGSVKFRFYLLHVILWNVGFMIIFTLLNRYVMEKSGLTAEEGALIGMFVGVLNTVGRIASVPLERFTSPLKVYVATTVLMGLLEMLIAAGWSQAGYAVPASAAGLCFGLMICYLVPVVGDLVGFENMTPALGYSNFVQGVGGLIGTPLLALMAGGSKFIVGGGITTASGLVMAYAALRHMKETKHSALQESNVGLNDETENGRGNGRGKGKEGAQSGYVLATNADEASVKYNRNLEELT